MLRGASHSSSLTPAWDAMAPMKVSISVLISACAVRPGNVGGMQCDSKGTQTRHMARTQKHKDTQTCKTPARLLPRTHARTRKLGYPHNHPHITTTPLLLPQPLMPRVYWRFVVIAASPYPESSAGESPSCHARLPSQHQALHREPRSLRLCWRWPEALPLRERGGGWGE